MSYKITFQLQIANRNFKFVRGTIDSSLTPKPKQHTMKELSIIQRLICFIANELFSMHRRKHVCRRVAVDVINSRRTLRANKVTHSIVVIVVIVVVIVIVVVVVIVVVGVCCRFIVDDNNFVWCQLRR